MRSRGGIVAENAQRTFAQAREGERVLVLGDGEHSYEALRIAEEVEAQGGIAAVQCITRSPAPRSCHGQCRAFRGCLWFRRALLSLQHSGHEPDRIIIAAEIASNQARMASEALNRLGSSIPVELFECHYGEEA
jgi:hypothetical protein